MNDCRNCLGARVRFIEIGGEYKRVPCLSCQPYEIHFVIEYWGVEDDNPLASVLADCFLYASAEMEKKRKRRKEGKRKDE